MEEVALPQHPPFVGGAVFVEAAPRAHESPETGAVDLVSMGGFWKNTHRIVWLPMEPDISAERSNRCPRATVRGA